MDKLIREGFPVERIVLRIDPIIPTPGGIKLASRVLDLGIEEYRITQYRISVIDPFPHVRERFVQAGIQPPFTGFQDADVQFTRVNSLVGETSEIIRNECDLTNCVECYAESKLTNAVQCGCISEYDIKLLGLKTDKHYSRGMQRQNRLFRSCKTELLTNKCNCPNGCLYCYWKG